MQVIPPAKRVALYARVSSEEQREGQTIDSQIAELERFAAQCTWQVSKVYKDDGWSGAILARPALDELRDDASKGLFHAVLINDVDRLARDVSHLGVLKRDLERHGVQVIFRKLPAEKSPTQNLMVNILGSFAEFERELIADRTRRGRRHKVESRGKFLGCLAPYGFKYSRKNPATGSGGILEVNFAEARVVRQMYSWVDREALSARQVLERLNHQGICPRKGSLKWAKSSVLRILRSEVYAGVWYYNKNESYEPVRRFGRERYKRSPKSGRRLRPRSEWFRVELPANLQVIKRDQWERVQRQLDKNRAFSARNSKRVYLLSGLIRCGGCGRRYVGDPCHGKFYYRCYARCKRAPTIKEDILNECVWGALKKAILNPQIIIKSVAQLNERRVIEASSKERELAEAEKPLQQIEFEEGRLLEAYRQAVISATQLGSELEKLNARRSSVQASKASLERQTPAITLHDIAGSVARYCSLIAKTLATLNDEGKRRLLRLLVNEIVFDGRTAKIKGVIPASGNALSVETSPASQHGAALSSSRIETMQIDQRGRNPAMGFILATAVVQKKGRIKITESYS